MWFRFLQTAASRQWSADDTLLHCKLCGSRGRSSRNHCSNCMSQLCVYKCGSWVVKAAYLMGTKTNNFYLCVHVIYSSILFSGIETTRLWCCMWYLESWGSSLYNVSRVRRLNGTFSSWFSRHYTMSIFNGKDNNNSWGEFPAWPNNRSLERSEGHYITVHPNEEDNEHFYKRDLSIVT